MARIGDSTRGPNDHDTGSIETADRELGEASRLASVAVLIALIIIGLVCAGLLKVALARRAEVERAERLAQAAWLAESGMDRAVTRLSASGDYAGEVWEIPAEEFGGRGSAKVSIRVEGVADHSDRKKVRVQADYPAGSSLQARQSREFVVAVQPPSR